MFGRFLYQLAPYLCGIGFKATSSSLSPNDEIPLWVLIILMPVVAPACIKCGLLHDSTIHQCTNLTMRVNYLLLLQWWQHYSSMLSVPTWMPMFILKLTSIFGTTLLLALNTANGFRPFTVARRLRYDDLQVNPCCFLIFLWTFFICFLLSVKLAPVLIWRRVVLCDVKRFYFLNIYNVFQYISSNCNCFALHWIMLHTFYHIAVSCGVLFQCVFNISRCLSLHCFTLGDDFVK